MVNREEIEKANDIAGNVFGQATLPVINGTHLMQLILPGMMREKSCFPVQRGVGLMIAGMGM